MHGILYISQVSVLFSMILHFSISKKPKPGSMSKQPLNPKPKPASRDPKRIQQPDPLEPKGHIYKDYIGNTAGLYRGSNF